MTELIENLAPLIAMGVFAFFAWIYYVLKKP